MAYQPQDKNTETGVLYGLEVTVNGGDNTKVDIAPGMARFVNWTNAAANKGKPHVCEVSYPGATAVVLDGSTTAPFTGLFIICPGGVATLEQIVTPDYNFSTRRNKVALPVVIHQIPTGVILDISEDFQLAYEWPQQINDMLHQVGVLSTGNRFSANGANLNVDKTAGTGSQLHFNAATNKEDPTKRISPAQTVGFFIYSKQESGGGGGEFTGVFIDAVDPDTWDNAGTLEAVPNAKYTVQVFFHFPQTSTTSVSFGQEIFNQESDAQDAIDDGSFDDNFIIPPNTTDGVRVTYLIVQEGQTNLTNAVFFQNRTALIK